MKIRTKLFGSSIAIFILFSLLLAFQLIAAKKENQVIRTMSSSHQKYVALLQMKAEINRFILSTSDVIIGGQIGNYKELSDIQQNIEEGFNQLDLIIKNESAATGKIGYADNGPGEAEFLQTMRQLYLDINKLAKEALKKSQSLMKDTDFQNQQIQEGKKYNQQLINTLDSWLEHESEKMRVAQDIFYRLIAYDKVLVISVTILSLIAVLILTYFFAHSITSRLNQLISGTRQIAAGDLYSTVPVSGRDELGILAHSFNHMVKQLAESQKMLLEQSYYSGMAEMASGILHNIRNAFTPMLNGLELIIRNMGEINLERFKNANHELINGDLPPARKHDLLEFVDTSYSVLESRLIKINELANKILRQATLVEKILAEQNLYAYQKQPFEKLPLADLARDAVSLVFKKILASTEVHLDPSLSEIGPVLTQRLIMVQVFANLIQNAAESLQRINKTGGRIDIRAETTTIDGEGFIHIAIADNGEGINKESLELIFQRGFSTKQKGVSGLGLHWCANSITALNGRIYAKSEGPGQGSCVHIMLPMDRNKYEHGNNHE